MTDKTHILVVDDEPDLRDMVEEYLVQQGFIVLTAKDGAVMRQIVAAQAVDLVVAGCKNARRRWSEPSSFSARAL